MNRGLPARLWPSPKQELLLRAVFAPDDDARAAWVEVQPSFDLDRLEDGSFALMPLLYRRLDEWDPQDPLVARLKGLYRHAWYRNNVLLERMREMLRHAGAKGIDVLVVGEPSLLVRAYPDAGLRPSTRIDLIVRPDGVRKLAAFCREAGWTEAGHRGRTTWFERAGGPTVALQRRLLPRSSRELEEDVWRSSVQLELNGTAHAAASATDELLRTCVGEERRFVWSRLQWIADVKFLLEAEGDAVDWDRALATAAAYRLTLPFREALQHARDAAGARVPDEVVRRLAETRPSMREVFAHRLSRIDRAAVAERIPPSARRAIRRLTPAR